MEHTEEAKVTAESAPTAGHILDGPCALGEERIVAEPLVGAEEDAQLLRNREREQEVVDRQETLSLSIQPGLLLRLAALVAGAVATAMIGKVLFTAAITSI